MPLNAGDQWVARRRGGLRRAEGDEGDRAEERHPVTTEREKRRMVMTVAPLSAGYSNVARPAVSGRRIRDGNGGSDGVAECAPAAGSARRPDPAVSAALSETRHDAGLRERLIAVWDVAWLKQKYPLHTHRYDLIGVSYVEGTASSRRASAPGRLTSTKAWVFQSNVAGNTHVEEGASDPPMRAILMEVKTPAPRPDVAEPPTACVRSLGAPSWDNKRAFAWAIPPGTAAPTHRHVRDAVELIFNASTPATTPKVTFVPAGTVHAGPVPEAGGRVFIFEIK